MSDGPDLQQELHQFTKDFAALRQAVTEVLVGHAEAIELTLAAMIAGGHVLLAGPRGVGKTLLGRTLAGLLDVTYRRIQFTSDLMPADIIGTYIVMESQGRRGLNSNKARFSPTCYWPTKSTGRRPRRRRPCLKPWKSIR